MANSQDPKSGVQGEGDYESARRYNQHTAEHVKQMTPKDLDAHDPGQSQDEAAQALALGKSKSKAGGQDLRDAEVFRALEKKHQS